MADPVNVVVTCTRQKAQAPRAALQFHRLPSGSLDKRFAIWVQRLETATGNSLPASALYMGNHWHVVRSLLARHTTRDPRVRFWVASAGYGLVSTEALLCPYSATFAHGLDSIGSRADAQYWWQLLATWEGPTPGEPRSLRELAARAPRQQLLVAVSATYARAMMDDILAAAKQLASPSQLAIISSGLKAGTQLDPYLICADSRYRQVVGGQLYSLNARLVQYALSRWGDWAPNTRTLKQLFEEQLQGLKPRETYRRQRLSDVDVIRYIRDETDKQPHIGHSVLLRRLRQSGRACGQNRFKQLFETVKAGARA